MKFALFFLGLFVFLPPVAQDSSATAYDEVSRKIGAGDCAGALHREQLLGEPAAGVPACSFSRRRKQLHQFAAAGLVELPRVS